MRAMAPASLVTWRNLIQAQSPSPQESDSSLNEFELGKKYAKIFAIYCTFTALIRKPLIINGAGEGNRTLV